MMLAIVIFKICRQLMGSSPLGRHRALPWTPLLLVPSPLIIFVWVGSSAADKFPQNCIFCTIILGWGYNHSAQAYTLCGFTKISAFAGNALQVILLWFSGFQFGGFV